MPREYKAAIDLDETLERPLADLSAVEFIQVLNHPKVGRAGFWIADKKKYELWVEEGVVLPKVTVAELLKKFRTEKKKVELELSPLVSGGRGLPTDALRRSEVEYAQLVEDVAWRVAEHLGKV